jgi:Fe-S-cluster containining protein
MGGLKAIVDVTYTDVCNACGGECCVRYVGNQFDSGELMTALNNDADFKERVLKYLARKLSIIAEMPYADSLRSVKTSLEQPHLLFHSSLQRLNTELNQGNSTKESRCLFYDSKEGCIIYEVRPDICRKYLCPRIGDLFQVPLSEKKNLFEL